MNRRIARTLLTHSFVTVLAATAALAHAQNSSDAVEWLSRIYQATHNLSYVGTFVYQQGEHSETSRITRLTSAHGNIEKLEALDGEPREILRTNDAVRCYLPKSRTVKIDRRFDHRGFPTLLQGEIGGLTQNYTVALGHSERIAGYSCEVVVLTPKDDLRYGYRLWADANSGMLLKALTFDGKGHTVEQFTFTQLTIGKVTQAEVKPQRTTAGWHVEDAEVAPVDLEQEGWRVESVLPGFRKVVEVRRTLRSSRTVEQVVYSDGLAAVSVFIEPLTAEDKPVQTGLASLGATNIYTREVANHLVTVVGEAPAASVQRIADAVNYHQPQ
ncbi:MAG TPA: MucB/RseB C-terminal domain-containing protein [Burkholderiales bacterium]|nr:MucB/RseB C-terminal domain-containing protein [Burkholderiales bacterium]HYA46882.1 MucB/RseB C-terminal domain-containing protein [Burkholderiales bacterium]